MPDNLPPPPTAAVVADLEARRRYDDHGSHFVDDQGLPIFDDSAPGCPTADAAGAARWLYKVKPSLWGNETSTQANATSPTPETATDVMRAVREGKLSSTEASAAIARLTGSSTSKVHVPTVPTKFKTFTDAMAAMRRGEPGAEAAVRAFMPR